MATTNMLNYLDIDERQYSIYKYLLKNPKQTANLIAKGTKINRTVTYDMLDKLIEKGLVNYVLIKNTKHFTASNPELLKDILKEKEDQLNKVIPELKSLSPEKQNSTNMEIYEGINGGITVIKDILNTNKDYVCFGDEGNFSQILKGLLSKKLVNELNKKKLNERILTKKGVKLIEPSKYTQIRYLSKNTSFPTMTIVYGKKVAIVLYEKPQKIIVIESEDLALTYRSIFEELWSIANKCNTSSEHNI